MNVTTSLKTDTYQPVPSVSGRWRAALKPLSVTLPIFLRFLGFQTSAVKGNTPRLLNSSMDAWQHFSLNALPNSLCRSATPLCTIRFRVWPWLFLALTASIMARVQPACAQEISATDQSRLSAAIVIATFDSLNERCNELGGYSAEQRAEVTQWESSQSVARLRSHLNGEGLSAALRDQVGTQASKLIQQIASRATPCVAAVSLTHLEDAQFAADLPQLLGGTTNIAATPPKGSPTGQPNKASVPTDPSAPVNSGNAVKLAPEIEGFAFDSCTRMGYGGMILSVPCPVVLFKNGSALTDVEGLNHPNGLAAHRTSNPENWTQWRRQGDRVQLNKTKGWEFTQYTPVYSTLPTNFRLDGRYRSMNGVGTLAVGGGQAVAAWTNYLFHPDGTVQRDGGVGSSSTDTDVSVTAGSTQAGRRGRYKVDGLVLAIDYDNGARERRIIIADPKDQGRGTMWLDGEGYVYKK